jgi:hypothetical protein
MTIHLGVHIHHVVDGKRKKAMKKTNVGRKGGQLDTQCKNICDFFKHNKFFLG